MYSIAAFALFVLLLDILIPPKTYAAIATPEPDLQIAIVLRPMASLHSDWHRRVSVSYKGGVISQDLFEDTGWWRGSNLYQHTSGVYVLHEGQGGCIGFTLDPLEFQTPPAAACQKSQTLPQASEGRSLYYQDLTYLGHFYETWRDQSGQRLRFDDPAQRPEVDLPAAL